MCCNCDNNGFLDRFSGGRNPHHERFDRVLSTFQNVRHFDVRSFDAIRRVPNNFGNCCRGRDEFQGIRPQFSGFDECNDGFGFGSGFGFGFGGNAGGNRHTRFDNCDDGDIDDDLDYIWL